MGCTNSAVQVEALWDARPVSSGADKKVFAGRYGGEPAVKAVALTTSSHDRGRIENEIKVYKSLGTHEGIVRMLHCDTNATLPYIVLEAVDPVGYDLCRLYNQYAFLHQQVPHSLMARVSRQLAGGLRHMHSKGMLHRDMKSENVLITSSHDAKICDMGLACTVGFTSESLRAAYLAPEICRGNEKMSNAVDSWGLGVALHQVYHLGHSWRLLSSKGPVRMVKGMPGVEGMSQPLGEAVLGLLRFAPSERWTVARFLDCEWLKQNNPTAKVQDRESHWVTPTSPKEASRRHVERYLSSQPPPTAIAVEVGPEQTNLVGKQLLELDMTRHYKATVMLVERTDSKFLTCPNGKDRLKEGDWIYLGIPQGEEEMEASMNGLMHAFGATVRSNSKQGLHRTDDSSPKPGTFLAFTLEFDAFYFPSHIGAEALIGPKMPSGPPLSLTDQEMLCLDLRANFGISLAGIQKPGKQGREVEVEWFPGPGAKVRPGDVGIIVRRPCGGGATSPTVKDEDLEPLMDPIMFKDRLAQRKAAAAADASRVREEVVILTSQNHDSVRLLEEPSEDATETRRVPSKTRAVQIAAFGDEFVRIRLADDTEGYVGSKNVRKAESVLAC